jgi:hypothetical protein
MSTFMDCGQGPSGVTANVARIEMNIRSQIRATRTGAQVETAMAASARNMEGTSNRGVQCGSTHRLEQEILKRLHTRLAK